jgi:ferrochelatase
MPAYDALLLLSFGGPEREADVMPFLENVVRGRRVPPERLEEVAQNYYRFGGRSPINGQNRALIAALEIELARRGVSLPVYWGNRNWHPLLAATLGEMQANGVRRALVLATSAYGSYSACRQYLDDLVRARAEVGPGAPVCDKLPPFCTRGGFIEASVARLQEELERLPPARREAAHLLFTAHSVPLEMARTSPYVGQLEEVARRVAAAAGRPRYRLVYQSRSGPPQQPWLEPDIRTALEEIAAAGGSRDVVVAPIGFISDHMEVVYDLDTEARERAAQLGLGMLRPGTVGTHPAFVAMLCDLISEALAAASWVEPCPPDCCPAPAKAGQSQPGLR